MDHLDEYPYEIRPLSSEEGGGFLVSYTDFSGCISDGETIEEAIANGRDALAATINALQLENLPVPAPSSGKTGKKIA
jgi:antitoxin HicB